MYFLLAELVDCKIRQFELWYLKLMRICIQM
jgi:hypothetical protein